MKTNVLYYGDNLPILRHRDYFPDASVDLIYLDPPFNSKADYNILFKEVSGESSQAQIRAFSDFWHWDQAAAETYHHLLTQGPPHVSRMMEALCDFIGHNDMTAYLVTMAARLIELHRVLKPTGSIYLHCDPTASHYLKVVMDTIFGERNFRNEITWKRFNFHADARRFGRLSDRLLFYTKSDSYTWNRLRVAFKESYIESHFKYVDEYGRRYRLDNLNPPGGRGPVYEFHGKTRPWRYTKEKMLELEAAGKIYVAPGGIPQVKRYLDELPGEALHEMWVDVPPINPRARERLGYETQKPLALLERIIQASSNPGDIVLDPFCGCGTAIVAAQKLGRRWIGIDVTHLAINIMKNRLKGSFGLEAGKDYEVIGEPADLESARALAAQGPGDEGRYQFQWWALSLIGAMPVGDDKKKGADKGMDGVITFMDAAGGKTARAIVQVKSGHVSSAQLRDLKGVMEREKTALGIFITLEPASAPMRTEAAAAGFHHSELWQRDFPRVQILTIEELLTGKRPEIPGPMSPYAQAQRIGRKEGKQLGLEGGKE